jgi:hypothetical protein
MDLLSKVLGTLGGKEGAGSKELWVDDAKCKACYECEAPFGLLVRRHHCRICGRIFCANCTANSVPPPRDSPDQQWQRVCNYCECGNARAAAAAAGAHRRRAALKTTPPADPGPLHALSRAPLPNAPCGDMLTSPLHPPVARVPGHRIRQRGVALPLRPQQEPGGSQAGSADAVRGGGPDDVARSGAGAAPQPGSPVRRGGPSAAGAGSGGNKPAGPGERRRNPQRVGLGRGRRGEAGRGRVWRAHD